MRTRNILAATVAATALSGAAIYLNSPDASAPQEESKETVPVVPEQPGTVLEVQRTFYSQQIRSFGQPEVVPSTRGDVPSDVPTVATPTEYPNRDQVNAPLVEEAPVAPAQQPVAGKVVWEDGMPIVTMTAEQLKLAAEIPKAFDGRPVNDAGIPEGYRVLYIQGKVPVIGLEGTQVNTLPTEYATPADVMERVRKAREAAQK